MCLQQRTNTHILAALPHGLEKRPVCNTNCPRTLTVATTTPYICVAEPAAGSGLRAGLFTSSMKRGGGLDDRDLATWHFKT